MSHKKGFTLLEILLVVGIISVLAGIVIIAINPARQLATVRDTERKSDIKQLYNAISQFYIDYGFYPASSTLTTTLAEVCDTGTLSSPSNLPCTGLIDLSELVPTYIVAIPKDPTGAIAWLPFIKTANAAVGGSGYMIAQNTNGALYVSAPNSEISEITAGSGSGVIAFTESFDSLDAWTVLSGSWVLSGGTLSKGASSPSAIAVTGLEAEEGTIQTRIDPYANLSGVIFREQDDDNYYFAALNPNYPPSILLFKHESGADIPLDSISFSEGLLPVGANHWHDLKVSYQNESEGMRVEIWLDGVSYINYLDTTPAWLSGGIGCRGYYGGSGEYHYWDDFSYSL